jgi:serine/threonine protein kinase
MNPVKVPVGYTVERVLSPGPATIVALARDPGGRACVIKSAAIERALPTLQNERSVLRALALAGVAGVPKLLDAWAEGFALELIAMPTLGQLAGLVRTDRRLRGAVANRAFARLAELHAAADPGGVPLDVVHGDLSPDNVFVADDGSDAILADFGLACWRGGGPPESGAFRGTLLYAAPEVARGDPFDGRADSFALAASLLHVATGIALREESETQAVTLVNAGTRPLDASHPWRALAPRLFNPELAEMLLACLAFDPRDRPRETPRPC